VRPVRTAMSEVRPARCRLDATSVVTAAIRRATGALD